MKTIVITGSTRGIGFALADEFLAQSCQVVVSGRTKLAVDQACKLLKGKHGKDHILGQVCNVTDFLSVQALWDAAKAHFGKIDIWINNAGVGHAVRNVWEIEPEKMHAIINTNVLGMLYGAKVAVNGFSDQGFGAIYIMEGKGSDGKVQRGMTAYGTSKRATNYLFNALEKELEETPILVGSLSPGMVVTGLLDDQRQLGVEEWDRTKKIFNILGDKAETVSPWLTKRILANQTTGATFRWLTGPRVLWRFLTARFIQRDLFRDEV